MLLSKQSFILKVYENADWKVLSLIGYFRVVLPLKKGTAYIILCHCWAIILERTKKVNLQINYLMAMTRPLLINYIFYQLFILPFTTVQSKFWCNTCMIIIDKIFMTLIINSFFVLALLEGYHIVWSIICNIYHICES